MNDLIIGALQEGGVQADHRQHSLASQTGCKGNCVLLCHAHVKEAFRVAVSKELQAGSIFHGSRNGTDLRVDHSFFFQRMAKHG